MTSHVPGATSDGYEELLDKLRDLVPAAFADGELDSTASVVKDSLTDRR